MSWSTDQSRAKVGHRYDVTVELPKDGRMVVQAQRAVGGWVLIGATQEAAVIAWADIREAYRGRG